MNEPEVNWRELMFAAKPRRQRICSVLYNLLMNATDKTDPRACRSLHFESFFQFFVVTLRQRHKHITD